ncbi:recombinase family protein [Catellatospora paridis]|uniref:recombinase family protein n=1 Tax=Catellatospora paridis TaxID=1617086 RepID=UPI0012D4C3C0|nr:recombinase family protein [Catellatospora paridis]
MSGNKKAVAYIRVSAVMGREEMISPELQMFEIETFAKRNGLDIVHRVEDIDRSGRSFTKRRIDELIAGIESSQWKYVILWKWSRWGRNLQQSLLYLAITEQAGGVVRAATEDFDPTTSVGRFTRDQMLLIAELQSNQMGDSWKEAHSKRRRDGLPHTTQKRLGYTYNRETGYIVQEDEAELVRDAYKQYVSGKSLVSLAAKWNARGLRTTQNKLWTDTSIRLMLDNGFAAGLIRERSDTQAGRRPEHFDRWRRGAHRPIISEGVWKAYQRRRAETARLPVRHRRATHAFSALLVCGHEACGRPMIAVKSGRKNYLNWSCKYAKDTKVHPSNTISNARLESAVMEWIERESTNNGDVDEEAGRFARADATAIEVGRLRGELSRLVMKRKRLLAAYTDGAVDEEDYKEQREEIKLAISATSAELDAEEERLTTEGADPLPAFRTIRDEWGRFTTEERHHALKAVLHRIVIQPGPFGPEKVQPVTRW